MTPLSEQVERPDLEKIREAWLAGEREGEGWTYTLIHYALALEKQLTERTALALGYVDENGHLTEQGKAHLEAMAPGARVLSEDEVARVRWVVLRASVLKGFERDAGKALAILDREVDDG